MSKQADRHNEGKVRYSLVPALPQKEYARVLMFGEQKYSANNWRKGRSFNETLECLMRHVEAFRGGEDLAPDSGCNHMAHVMANAAFLIEYMAHRPEFDDRFKYEKETKKEGVKVGMGGILSANASCTSTFTPGSTINYTGLLSYSKGTAV